MYVYRYVYVFVILSRANIKTKNKKQNYTKEVQQTQYDKYLIQKVFLIKNVKVLYRDNLQKIIFAREYRAQI